MTPGYPLGYTSSMVFNTADAAREQVRTITSLSGVKVDSGKVLDLMIARGTWAPGRTIELGPLWAAVDAVEAEPKR